MKKWIKVKSMLVILLAVIMMIPQNLVFAETPQEPTLKSEVKYDEGKKTAEIKLTPQVDTTKYEIREVLDPNGTDMDLSNLNYKVNANGEYIFTLRYIEKQETDDKKTTESLEDEIKNEEILKEIQEKVVIEDIAPVKEPETPSVVSTTGTESVKISIDGYNPTTEIWKYADGAKTITVTADFGDNTSENKTLEVYLPRGLHWKSIPVVDGKYTKGAVSEDRLNRITNSDPLFTAITAIDLRGSAQKQDYSYQYSGSLQYTFTSGTEKVTLQFVIEIDSGMIYGKDVKMKEAITAKIGKGDQPVVNKDQIMNIHLGGNYEASGEFLRSYPSSGYAENVLASTIDEISYNETNQVVTNVPVYVKAKVTLYYPKGMHYEGLTGGVNNYISYISNLRYDDAEGKVEFDHSRFLIGWKIGARFSIPEGAEVKRYTVSNKDSIEATYFDGVEQKFTVSDTEPEYFFNVVGSESVSQKMEITSVTNRYTDNTIENAFNYAPVFEIDNRSNAGSINNQTVEFDIDPNWEVTRIHLPFDGTVSDNTITDLWYKTSKSDIWQSTALTERDLSNVVTNTVIAKILTKEKLDLEHDEYITGVKYKVKRFSNNYYATPSVVPAAVNTYGKLNSNSSRATVTLSFYDENNKGATLVSKEGIIENAPTSIRQVMSDNAGIIYDSSGKRVNSFIAGETVTLKIPTGLVTAQYGRIVMAMKDVVFYLREEDGLYFQMDTLQIIDHNGKALPKDKYSIIQRTSNDGKNVYEIRTKDTITSSYYGEDAKYVDTSLSINVTTDPKMEAQTIKTGNLARFTGAYLSSMYGSMLDDFDLNGDGSTKDHLYGKHIDVQVMKNNRVLVETFLSLAGQGTQKPYVEGDKNTLSYFTPGTQADYLVNILNNTDRPASAFDAYVPIPKEGQNFGTAFQQEDFNWNMKLASEMVLSAEDQKYFDVYYATNATKDNYQDEGIYSKTPPNDLSQVNMVHIKAKTPIPSGHNASIKVAIVIDETLDSATNKIGTKNIYNPVYKVTSDTFIGTLNATKVGSELVIAEISGTMFNDKNGNGLYELNMDTPILGHTVSLYKLNDKTNVYEPVLDDKAHPVTTMTDMNGKYTFDYHQNLGYETYAVSFGKPGDKKKYTVYSSADAANNSNVINQSNYPMAGDDYEGWIIGIDATKPQSTQLNAGIVSYDPDSLAISNIESTYTVKERQLITIQPTITPNIFDGIKDPNKGYQWELVNPSDSQYVTLMNPKEKDLKISGKLITGVNKVQVKLTITDIYGNTREAQTEISVLTNEAPVITVPKVIEKNIGDLWDAKDPDIVTGLAISDDHDQVSIDDITVTESVPVEGKFLRLFSTKDTNKLKEIGTYQITYSYTDKDNNTTTEYVVLKVNGLPYLKDNSGTDLDEQAMPEKYVRIGASIDPFENIHAYYQKASDKVGELPAETEINPDDPATGTVAWQGTWDKDNNPVTGGIIEVGKYRAAYRITSPTHGFIDVSRTVYARGRIQASAQSIAIKDDTTTYTTLEEFLNQYGNKIKLQGSVKATDVDGNVTDVNLTDFTLQDHEDISQISFDRVDKTAPVTMTIHVLVHDRGDKNYEPASLIVPLVITIQDTTGNPPVITFKDKRAPTERKATDKVLMEPEKIATKEDYEKAQDLLENHTDPLTFYNKLMSDAVIEDQQDGTGHDNVGIKTSGIAGIKKINSDLSETVLISNDAEARAKQDILMKLYTEVGHYEVTYYAIDNDENRIESARHIHTAGETKFVNNMADKIPAEAKVILRTDAVNQYQPSGVVAYHTDYDGKTLHETAVHEPPAITIDQAGRYTVDFTTGYHYASYGETSVARGLDKFVQDIEVYGEVTFENEPADTENFYVGEQVKLKNATAYVNGPTQVSNSVERISLEVKNSLGQAILEMDSAGTQTVTYTADDGLGLSDSQKTLTKTYHFYGLPELTLTHNSIEIGEMTTKEEVTRRIGAMATVALPDGGTANANIENNYENYGSTGNTITVTASFTTPDGKTRTVSQEVTVRKVAGAQLEAHDFTLNEGDSISDEIVRSLSGLKIEHATLTKNDVTITAGIPQTDGKVTAAGTYPVTLTADDKSNSVSININVYVNGQPVIAGLNSIATRAGMTIDAVHGVKATYSKAGTDTEFDFSSSGKDRLSIIGYEAINEDGKRQPVNAMTKPGVYIITYKAVTESGGEAKAERKVTVHGIPVIEANASIAIRRGESADDFLNQFKNELGIRATLIQTELKEGKTVLNTVDLSDDKINIDLSQVKFNENGSYEAVIKATADESGIPKYTTEKRIIINVGDYQGAIPEIRTSVKERQSDDPIQNEADIKSYLLSDQMIQVKKTDYEIQSIILKSIEKQSTARAGARIDVKDNAALKEMMTTEGIYILTYEITDKANNIVEAQAEFRVHGPVKFGIQNEDGSITELGSVIETRQSTGSYTGHHLVSWQMMADGRTAIAPVQMSKTASLEKVAMHEIELKGQSVTDTYEDGQKRPVPGVKVKLLVQGNITFIAADRIETYQGSALKEQYQAFIETVDENGKTAKTELPVTIRENVKTDTIHNGTLVLEAKDTLTKAPDAIQTYTIHVKVHGLPVIEAAEAIEVKPGASLSEIIEQLKASGWHINSDGEKIDLSNRIVYEMLDDRSEMRLSIAYTDRGEEKRIERTVRMIYQKGQEAEGSQVKTGDSQKIEIYEGVLLASGLLLIAAGIIRKRRKEEEQKKK